MRAHLRHIVRDREGNVIQNAAVFVYEVGTTTPVAMHDARTGGDVVTNPLITNDQGEAEAWIDDGGMSVDLSVTDNSNTAYHPTAPLLLLTFTSVTEYVEVFPHPDDMVTGITGPQGPEGDPGPQGDPGDPGPGVAAGGTAGQLLSKVDETDYNTTWVTIAYQALSVIDGKGELFVGSANDATDNLAAGTDFHHLRSRAAATLGVEWAALATGAAVDTNESTTSATYTDLATPGPEVTLTTGTTVLIILTCDLYNSAGGNYGAMSYAVSGATTIAASSAGAIVSTASAAGKDMQQSTVSLLTGLTPGSNTFTAKYLTSAGTENFLRRGIIVIPL